MTFWNLYFILKLYLFATGHLQPIWTANIAFALALALSSPQVVDRSSLQDRPWTSEEPAMSPVHPGVTPVAS